MCGASYWPVAWIALPFVGTLDADEDLPIELRNCHCGSTIAIEGTASPTLAVFVDREDREDRDDREPRK